MREKRVELKIDEIEFDDSNPRIKAALEKYSDKIDAERIHFALQNSSDDGAKNASGFHQLKTSIKANEGIAEPIKVVKKDGRTICIDGNTRLAIYRDFAKGDSSEQWSNIPALVLENATQVDIEKIRVTAHLIGARPWPPYERAKYLKYLRYEKLLDYDELVALCGGGRADIEQQIDAFDDMEEYYRDRVEDSEFKIDRFSGFTELQKRGVKEAIYEAGFGLQDFGDWINKGNIYALQDVRLLPKVLRDEEATRKFVNGGVGSIKQAARFVDDKNRGEDEGNQNLQEATLEALAYAFRIKLENMTQLGLDELSSDENAQEMLESLSDRLLDTLRYVGKQ